MLTVLNKQEDAALPLESQTRVTGDNDDLQLRAGLIVRQ